MPDRERRLRQTAMREAKRSRRKYRQSLPTWPPGSLPQQRAILRVEAKRNAMIREILGILGHDPDAAPRLVACEAEINDLLAALPPPAPDEPSGADWPTVAGATTEEQEKFARRVAYYSDPKHPAPDIANESLYTLHTYVLGRWKYYDSDNGQ
jgi:hypothetical protein